MDCEQKKTNCRSRVLVVVPRRRRSSSYRVRVVEERVRHVGDGLLVPVVGVVRLVLGRVHKLRGGEGNHLDTV